MYEIEVGMRVSCSVDGIDFGVVLEVTDGDPEDQMALVAWDSGVTTMAPCGYLTSVEA